MKDSVVRARFESADDDPWSYTPDKQRLLQNTPPEVSAALCAIYPFLIVANRVLASITWTAKEERTAYRNSVFIMLYTIMLLHWNDYLIIVLPSLIAFAFCFTAQVIRRCYIEYRYVIVESDVTAPTLEEILGALDNFNLRCTFLLSFGRRNGKVADQTSFQLLKPTFINFVLLTPFYSYIMRHYLSANVWIAVMGSFMFTFYSTSFIAFRRVLWRSRHIRQMFIFLTNIKFPLTDKETEINFLSLNVKKTINDNTKIVEFELLENERRWVGLGWSKRMLFFDRSPFSTLDMSQQLRKTDQFQFPVMNNYKNISWKWLDPQWKPANKKHSWTYYDNFWKNPSSHDSVASYTRSRVIRRQCVVELRRKKDIAL